MNIDRYTQAEIAQGEALLKTILRTFKKKGLTGQPPFGARLSDAWQYYGPHNLQAFIVTYRNGGWIADVVLRNVPEGYGDVLGTLERSPFPTYEDAFRAGLFLLCSLLSDTQSATPLNS